MTMTLVVIWWVEWIGADNWHRAVVEEETNSTSVQCRYKNVASQLTDVTHWHSRLHGPHTLQLALAVAKHNIFTSTKKVMFSLALVFVS